MSIEYKSEIKPIRCRKLGEYTIILYQDCMTGCYVLQEYNKYKGHYITHDSSKNYMLATYKRIVDEYKLMNGR